MANHWLDTSEYPFHSKYHLVNGTRLHYIDEGQGETILFVHGTPSWSFDFRRVIKKLSSEFRCIAIDHVGFGLSDKPAAYNYSTQNHSDSLKQFVFDKQLYDINLVIHDFGGPIALNFAVQHPERIKKLVILNSWCWGSEQEPEFQKLKKMLQHPLLPFLYRYLNFSPRYILPRSFGEHKITRHLLKQYTKPFKNATQRNGTLAFARSLLNDQSWFENIWTKRQFIANKPTLLIWGMKDPVISTKYLAKWKKGLPNAKVVELSASGHFPQEEQPELVTAAIETFLH
jgi:pimeloyl-ACP methyl ester carboxylesterase